MNEEFREREDARKRLEWDIFSMANGHGFRLTNKEAVVVMKILGDAMEKATNATAARDIGSPEDVRTAVALYVRLGTAMPSE